MNFNSVDRYLLDSLIPATNNQPSLSSVLDRQLLKFRLSEELDHLLHWYLSIANQYLLKEGADIQVVLKNLHLASVHRARRLVYLIVEIYVSDREVFEVLYERRNVLSGPGITLSQGDLNKLVTPVLASNISYRTVNL